MAHIVEFSVSGLAGHEGTLSQRLNRDINIFFGLNGSGKTSLLKILHSAMSNETDILKNVPFKNAEVRIYSARYQKEFTYSIEQEYATTQVSETNIEAIQSGLWTIRGIRSELPPSRNWHIKPKLPSDFKGVWSHQYLPTSRLYLGIRSYPAFSSNLQPLTEEELDRYFGFYLQQLWSQYSSDILSEVRKAQENGLASIFDAIAKVV